MKDILFWILPPIIGAFIGYVTNLVAIKMLFRPLKKVKLLGISLPFTPGILPRERHKLAESIGRMVEQELLTSEVLRERLARTEVRGKIKDNLGAYTGQILTRPLSLLLEDKSGLPISEMASDFVNSDVFDSFLEEIIRNWAMGKSPDNSDSTNVVYWLKSRFRDIGGIFIPAARELIKSGLVREIKNHARGEPAFYRRALESVAEKYPGITLGEFLSISSSKKRRTDYLLAEKVTDTLDKNIEGALSSVDVRALVTDRINSLDMIRVEKIILDVMAGQLWWINLFGGILGAIIGFTEVIVSFFFR